MVNYKMIGNIQPEEVFGSKENAERVLRSLNHSKTIGVKLGSEYNPPYIWNKNLPESWVLIIGDAVMNEVMKDMKWQPDEAFIDKLRKQCREAL